MNRNIKVINPKSNIAICTLWTNKELLESKLPKEVLNKINIYGTLYTIPGINYMLETLARHPEIDTLVLFGADLSESGNAVYKLFNEKKLDEIRILLPKEIVKKVIQDVKLIDLREEFKRGNWKVLIEVINKYFNPNRKPTREKFDVKVEEQSGISSWPVPLSGQYIYDTSIFRAWLKILDTIMRFGYVKFTEYSEAEKEYLNIMVTLGFYGNDYKIEEEFYEWIKPEEFRRHINEVLNPNKPDGVDYTYGERIFRHRFGKNQIEYLINKLSKTHYSRRAVVISWDHEIDQNTRNPPCIIMIQGLISGNYYNHIVVIRSNDMFRGWPVNVVGQIELAKYIISEINKRTGSSFKLGTVTTISVSAHIYEHDWKFAREVLNRYGHKLFEFVEDPKGNYLLYSKNNKIVIEHRTPNNSIIVDKFETDSFLEAYTRFKNESLFSLHSHALYIGKELKTAFEKLKRGEKYIQGEA